MKLIFKIALIFFLVCKIADAQQVKLVVKLKASAPDGLVQSLKSNFKSQQYRLTKILSKFNTSVPKKLFPENSLNKLSARDITSNGFDRIFIINSEPEKSSSLLSLINTDKDVEYAEKVSEFRLNNFPINDPYFPNQYYLSKINSPQSLEITQGDSTIIIGVIDSGLDFTHPDLLQSFKINYAETQNGIDDDGNGYIDDIRGWNFVDDNNNPQDNNLYSHGTSVTGIINAAINNGIGIASVAPKCKVLVLKAFDANGIGGEDDVARAILYGMGRGVKVFNMSFGDVIYSRLLRDVIRYAYGKNIVLIASAGNTGNDVIQYPSAFDEVISAGASDIYDSKAQFSSYGETVDIFAPGANIFTTSITGKGSDEFEKNYFYVNGTSFSAPIIAASAALLLSVNNSLTNEEVRGILTSTTGYMSGQTQWDKTHSSGRLNLYNALLNYKNPSAVKFNFPYQNFTTSSDTIPVCITAASTFFSSYSVFCTDLSGTIPPQTVIDHSLQQSINDTVAYLDLSQYPDTILNLHITLYTTSGRTIENGIFINKDTKPPVIDSNYSNADIFIGNKTGHLFSFTTAKPTIGIIFYRKKNSNDEYRYIFADLGYENIGYVSATHFGIIDESDLPLNTQYEFYIQAEGLNGKTAQATDSNFVFTVNPPVSSGGYVQKSYTLPAVQFADSVVNNLANGNKNIFVNLLDSNLRLAVYQFTGSGFNKISHNEWEDLITARSFGFVNHTGKLDMLASKGRAGLLFEQPASGMLPVKTIWSGNDFWAAKIFDVDRNGAAEVFGFSQSGLKVMQFNNGVATVTASLPYSSLDAEVNSQSLLFGSLNPPGISYLAFTDLKFSANQVPETHLNLFDYDSPYDYNLLDRYAIEGEMIKGECLVSADIDNDGQKEICLLTSSGSTSLIPYYALHVYKIINRKLTEQQPYYFYNTSASSSSLTALNSQQDYLYVNIGNNLYVMTCNNSPLLTAVYFRNDINSFNSLSYDFDGNGIPETGFVTTGGTTIFLERIANPLSPVPPASVSSYGDDSNKVVLNYSETAGASYYKIYRSLNDSSYTVIDSTSNLNYIDRAVINNTAYYYKVSTVNNSYQNHESILSEKTKSFVHNKIRLSSAQTSGYKNLSVTFSGSISHNIPSPADFIISGLEAPSSVSYKSDREYILNFGTRLPNGNFSLRTKTLKDIYGSPVDSNPVNFSVMLRDTSEFFIRSASFISDKKIKVEFNLDADSNSVKAISNYTFEPAYIAVTNASPDAADKKIIYLELGGSGRTGATGIIYLLRIKNLLSSDGIPIVTGSGSSYSFSFVKETLDDVTVFPNPLVMSSSKGYLTFANLTKQAEVYIFDISGRFIQKIVSLETSGGIRWDLKDSGGNDVATGIYIYRVTGKDSGGNDVKEKVSKFAVIK